MKLAGRTTATPVYKHIALQGRHLDTGGNPVIARDIDKTPGKNIREVMLSDIMKKQSKSLTAKVVTRRCFESRRDRKSRQLDDFLQVVFILISEVAGASVAYVFSH